MVIELKRYPIYAKNCEECIHVTKNINEFTDWKSNFEKMSFIEARIIAPKTNHFPFCCLYNLKVNNIDIKNCDKD